METVGESNAPNGAIEILGSTLATKRHIRYLCRDERSFAVRQVPPVPHGVIVSDCQSEKLNIVSNRTPIQ
jgi:hypothetical protein